MRPVGRYACVAAGLTFVAAVVTSVLREQNERVDVAPQRRAVVSTDVGVGESKVRSTAAVNELVEEPKPAAAVADAATALDRAIAIMNDPERQTEAEHLFRAALAANPADPVALVELRDLLMRRGEQAEADDLVREAAASCDDCPDAGIALADVLIKEGNVDGAIAELKRAAEFDSVRELATRRLAHAYELAGDLQAAATALEDAIADAEAFEAAVKAAGADTGVLSANLHRDKAALRELRRKLGNG